MKKLLYPIIPLLFFLGLFTDGAIAQESHKPPFINQWEVSYGAGSPFGTTEWRNIKTTHFTQKFSQMWQVNFCHQFTADDYGAASAGYRYPAIGAYLQWLDYSHLQIRGNGDPISADRHYDYGQIISFGWTLHQYCWTQGKWRGHLNLENGAAYVFSPYYSPEPVATLANPWQILVGVGWYFDRECRGGEIAIGPQFTHLSNSGWAAFNAGINNISLCLRYRHKSLRDVQQCPAERALTERDGTRFAPHLYGSLMAGLGGVYFEDRQHASPQLTLMADLMYRLSPTHGLGLGFDYYHSTVPNRTDQKDYLGTAIKYDHWWGPFVVHLQTGVYLNERRPITWKGAARFYETIGFKYVLCRNQKLSPYAGIYTKGNDFNAEQMAFSVGMIIK